MFWGPNGSQEEYFFPGDFSPEINIPTYFPCNFVKCLLQIDKCIIQPVILCSKLLLNLPGYENGICCTAAMYESKLYIINFHLLSDLFSVMHYILHLSSLSSRQWSVQLVTLCPSSITSCWCRRQLSRRLGTRCWIHRPTLLTKQRRSGPNGSPCWKPMSDLNTESQHRRGGITHGHERIVFR